MSCHNHKECNCHQNSSFIFGLIVGLIIAAVIAIVIYKKNRGKVFENLKKTLEKVYRSVVEIEIFKNTSTLSKKVEINNSGKESKKKVNKLSKKKSLPKTHKIAVTLPKELIQREFGVKTSPQKSNPRVFKR